jgi:outer membrane receptor protein involved in Fe transport
VLVLVNGKRRHNTATMFINGTTQSGQSPPDLDLIASNAIGRVEVLRDGAAAQYGSDAIAGVINIVLKNDTGSASLLGGRDRGGDGVQARMQVDKGFRLGAGTLHLSAEAYNQGHTYRSGINTLVNQDTNMGGQPGVVSQWRDRLRDAGERGRHALLVRHGQRPSGRWLADLSHAHRQHQLHQPVPQRLFPASLSDRL